eukprot:1213041-Prymnesium_polylepis.1
MLQPYQLHLWKAADSGDTAGLRRALDEGASVYCSNRLGWNALHCACRVDDVEAMQMVLDAGAAELERAAKPEAGSSVKEHPPLITTQDGEGNSPLHVAAGCGNLEVVRALLKAGADVAAKKKFGGTPMHTCCQAIADAKSSEQTEKLHEVVVALLNAGGLLEATDDNEDPARLTALALPAGTLASGTASRCPRARPAAIRSSARLYVRVPSTGLRDGT